jgi:hypothetical protein
MSMGLGRVGRVVEATFRAEPDNAFTTEDLCDRAYPGTNWIPRARRNAVMRAAKDLAARRPELGLQWFVSDGLGGTLVFFSRHNVMSYAMARNKASCAAGSGRSSARRTAIA